MQTNDSYIGGLVRQHGNLSYIRTYQAGHAIPSYQPEMAYKIFIRALFNLDIATSTKSKVVTIRTYSCKLPHRTWLTAIPLLQIRATTGNKTLLQIAPPKYATGSL